MNGTATSHNTSGSAFGRLAAASEPTGRVAAGAGERICSRERMVSLGPVGFGRFGARRDVIGQRVDGLPTLESLVRWQACQNGGGRYPGIEGGLVYQLNP